jgi:hypothetical protein
VTPKGLQLTKPGDHAMVAYVQMGMSRWVWTSPGVRVFGPPLVNPVWIAINILLRARGLRLGANATTAQLNLAETFFDVQAAHRRGRCLQSAGDRARRRKR